VVEVRRHNASFCRGHFVEHVHRQVARTIDDFKMFGLEDRLLLGVSGGKDSLALWHVLTCLGYQVDGVYLHLGIGDYSSASLRLADGFARNHGLSLEVVDLPTQFGFGVPEAAQASRRTPCSACGLSKRYILNQVAAQRGYDVLVTGHNLDDEAATLFANVLNWKTEYLGRQHPVLPATREGLCRKAKPLIRVAERESAAYAILTGIEYEVEECPMAAGNTINRYKGWLNQLEEQSPGVKAAFLLGFLERAAFLFDEGIQPEVTVCASCGQATTGDICAFCRLQSLTLSAKPSP
jgi:uncharacterized protein (TIGR00269 family)